jgi:raffinose/stachyose/melibiose transport system permease protein
MSPVDRATGRYEGERLADQPLPPARPARPSALLSRKTAEILLLLAPALALYIMFVLLPVGQSAYYSLFKWNGLEPLTNFIGLANYRRALTDEVFLTSLQNNAFVIVASLVVQLPIGLGLAILLNRKMLGRSALRMVVFAPYVLAEVVAGVAWKLILDPDGLVDWIFVKLHLQGLIQLWLSDTDIVMYTMFGVITWKYIGFAVILFLAGLQGIPKELSEAAKIDGASGWQLTRRITIPLLGPTIRIWVFLSIIGSIQLFDLIWVTTFGGPANASSTAVTYMYVRGFQRSSFGYGSAVAVIVFVLSFIFALVYQRYVMRRDIEGATSRRVG